MLFNSLDFAIFLPIVFILYWFILKNNLKLQNALIVVSSYIFYGWWDWRFLTLILFSTLVDYTIGQRLRSEEKETKRKILLWTSILVNLGFLGFFKYYNFFLENFVSAFSLFGMEIKANTLNIILPVGISFYTFQTLSYTIDVYNRKLEPTKDILSFSAFVSFFPQLVAGPIERASNLLPQFYIKRRFDYHKAVDGMRQILWGLFKKVVIADNCAEYANLIFNNSADYSGSTLALGVLFFSIQIYGDFSGYSDIAIGTSRLFGFDLKQNFSAPYFSKNIVEFWRRWHMSLGKWLTDYVFTPLAINFRHLERKGLAISILITFLLSGLWHGAGWNFIVFGLIHAIYYLVTILLVSHKKLFKKEISENRKLPSFKESLAMLFTFVLVSFSYIFFRAGTMSHAFNFIKDMFVGFTDKNGYIQSINLIHWEIGYLIPILIMIFIVLEWIGRESKFALERIGYTWKRPLRILFYYAIIFTIFWLGGVEQQFIYFQF